jgi:hypothetical protein
MKKSDRRIITKLVIKRESVRVLASTDLVNVAGAVDSHATCINQGASASKAPPCG